MIVFDVPDWYVLRVTYSREMIVKKYCDTNSIINFVPMMYKIQENDGIKSKKLVPAVHNLIFIKATRQFIHELKRRFPLRFLMDHEKKHPITIPEKEMQHFISVASNYNEQIVYLTPDELKMKVGSKVRINSGIFKGVEGTLIRVRNNKRVVVQIKGLVIVATNYIHPSMMEKIG